MAANILWAHLLRKDATSTDTPSQIPPLAPQDKTGTSMRMLIHDTQANLEKFSTRLDGLLQRVDDCRAEVVNANKLLDVERDKVLTEILTIVNRCQCEIKTHVGTPAQAAALDLAHVSQASTEKSVQALEKRIDALQALLQSHVNAMQSIQDQQNTLIGTILPLVPILHGVAPQMDQIKTALSDMVTNAVSAITRSVESVRSTMVAEFAHPHGYGRSSTRLGSNRPTSSSRRKRPNASEFGPQENNHPLSSPLDSRNHEGPHRDPKRARIEGMTSHGDNTLFPRKLSRLAVVPTNPGDPSYLLRTPGTPRQPLADLPLPSAVSNSVQHHMTSRMNPTPLDHVSHLETHRAAGDPSTSQIRPPFRNAEHARHPSRGVTIIRQPSVALQDMIAITNESSVVLPSIAGPSNGDMLSKVIKFEEILEPDLSGVISIHSSPLSSPPSSLPHPTRDEITTVARRDSQPRQNTVNMPRVECVQESNPISWDVETSPPKSMSLRDRRAQMSRFGRAETRRFIPMVPWSDEEE